ncbi:non-ribosomal peptide synthetase, partial [Niastella yeongjuensis]
LSGEPQGNRISAERQRETVLDVTGITVGGKLRLSVSYSNKQYNQSTIEELTGVYRQELEALIRELSVITTERLTPVDLTWKELSVVQWESLNRDEQLEDVYPLSPLQEGLYYQWLMNPRAGAYFEQMSYGVQGELDLGLLARSYELLVQRHAVLRTCFSRELGERPLQLVKKTVAGGFHYEDKTRDPDFSIEALRAADRSKGFDLHQGSQMRLTLTKLDQERYEFVWSHHHILMDGWCVGILIKEFFEIYYSLQQGREPALPKVHPYARYIDWLDKTDQRTSLTYWTDYLAGYETLASIPHKLLQPGNNWQPRRRAFTIEGEVRQSIRTLCAGLGITENTFIQMAWAIVLSKYNNTTDVVFGSVVSGRPEELEGVENMIGLFVNTIPVRISIQESTGIAELLKAVQQEAIQSRPYQYSQLIEVQSASVPGKNLFDHILIFENYPVQEMAHAHGTGGLTVIDAGVNWQTNFDLSVMIIPQETMRIEFVYNDQLYEETQMARLQYHLQQVIGQMVQHPQGTTGDIDFLHPEERTQLLTEFNDTSVAYPRQHTLISLFEEQAAKTPDVVALVFENTELTYRQLNEQANRLGHYLRSQYGILADDLVGIQLERNERAVLATLAVLKSGAGCVPIDPAAPPVRIDQMLADCGCKVIIDEKTFTAIENNAALYSINNPPAINTPDKLCYIIYTSGSTGRPKGCMLEHRGVINHLFSKLNQLHLQQGEVLCHTSELHFVGGIWQLWGPLVTGGRVLLCNKEELANIEQLLVKANANNVRILEIIPSQLNEYLLYEEQLPLGSIKTLILTGEKLTPYFVNKCYKGNAEVEIFNTYGQTESSDVTTCYKVPPTGLLEDKVLIGNTIQNMRQYVVSADGSLCATGVVGEIWTSGVGVSRGYINQPEQTAIRFTDNPFHKGERLYRTGDLGRRLPDGQLEIVGRKDNQLKIRGFRVEPGEIEAALLQQPGIEETVVLQYEDQKTTEKSLVAYLVCREEPDLQHLRASLAQTMPVYMQPARYVLLQKMPLLPNGKADKKALAGYEATAFNRETEHVEPVTETEIRLAVIWREILNKETISTKDNFFHIGGHSLKAIRLASQIHKQFNINLNLSTLFNKPTIESLADEIEKTGWANNELFEIDDVEKVSI